MITGGNVAAFVLIKTQFVILGRSIDVIDIVFSIIAADVRYSQTGNLTIRVRFVYVVSLMRTVRQRPTALINYSRSHCLLIFRLYNANKNISLHLLRSIKAEVFTISAIVFRLVSGCVCYIILIYFIYPSFKFIRYVIPGMMR